LYALRQINYQEIVQTMAVVMHWDTDAFGVLSEEKLRKQLENMGYRVQRYVYSPGTFFPDHVHDVDKIDAVLAGSLEIQLQGDSIILNPGDYVAVPRGVPHNARVIGNEAVISLDAVKAVI
jgi:quercetin dioxygenase-like cupin family protein